MRLKETLDIHPLVALWLTKNGYSYTHEYKLPDYGRVDFYATHSDGHTMLVEAKGQSSAIGAIFQVLSYKMQIPDAKASVAIPRQYITPEMNAIAEKYNVMVIAIDIEELIEQLRIKQEKAIELASSERFLRETITEGVSLIYRIKQEGAPLWEQAINVVNGSICAIALMHYYQMTDNHGYSKDDAVSKLVSIFSWASVFVHADRSKISKWVSDLISGNHWYLYD